MIGAVERIGKTSERNGNKICYVIGNTKITHWKNWKKWTIAEGIPQIDTKWGLYCVEHWQELGLGASRIQQNIVIDDFNVWRNGDVKAKVEEGKDGYDEDQKHSAKQLKDEDAIIAARTYAYIATFTKSEGPGGGKSHLDKCATQYAIWRNCGPYLLKVHVDEIAVASKWEEDKAVIGGTKTDQIDYEAMDYAYMMDTPKTPTVTATNSKLKDHPTRPDWLIIGPFSASFIQERGEYSGKIFADEYESTVNGHVRASGKWHFCNEKGELITVLDGNGEKFYIEVKKSWIGNGNITFQLKTRRLKVCAEWWDISNSNGKQAQILVASAIRKFVYADAASVVISPPQVTIHKVDQDTNENLAGVQFHIYKGANQYITGFDSSGYPTYGAKANAKTFTTDSTGKVAAFKAETTSYKAVEISVGDNIGYAAGKVFDINVTGTGNNTITLKNKREFIPVSGYVWEDLLSDEGKASGLNSLYKDGDKDINDKLVEGIKVELVKVNPQTKAETVEEIQYTSTDTETKGKYKFSKVKIDEIANYYIRFYYNGMCYENVDKKTGDKATKAMEGSERNSFNNNYSTIEGNTSDTGKSLDEKGNKKYDIAYKKTARTSEICYRSDRDETKYNFGYEENKNSKYPVSGVDDQYIITATTTNYYGGNLDKIKTAAQIRSEKIKEIGNINLGIRKRAQPDIALVKDLHNVQVEVNGYGHTYLYGKRFEQGKYEKEKEGEEDTNTGVKFGNNYTGTYTREIYQSDYDYTNEQKKDKELKVWVTYKIDMAQASKGIKTKINSIIDYYDESYTLEKVGTSINETTGKIEGDDITPDEDGIKKVDGTKYNKIIIENNTEIEPDEEVGNIRKKSIYIRFKVEKDKVGKLLEADSEDLDNIAEINSYSIFNAKDGTTRAGIDIDSNPGNANPKNEAEYEDDTSASPGLKITQATPRKLTGKVFIDKTTGEVAFKKGQERKGNGEYDGNKDQEPGVGEVEITFTDKNSGNVYKTTTVSTAGNYTFTTTTDDNNKQIYNITATLNNTDDDSSKYLETGDFFIPGYIPGNYTLTYTWGGQTYTLNGQKKEITVQNYKGTIYPKPERETDKEWYKDEVNIRRSDAKDNWTKRKQIDGEMKTVNKNTSASTTQMDSTTPEMKIRVENQEKEDNENSEPEYQTGKAENYSKDYQYNIKNVDFGIIERPKQDLKITKRVKALKLTLANGQTIANFTIDNGQPNGSRKGVTYMPPIYSAKYNGFVRLELDNELIQGSQLEVTYEIMVENISEQDYNNENYYLYGIDDQSNPVQIKPTKIIDYLDKGWAFKAEGTDWEIKKGVDEVKEWLHDNVMDEKKSIEENRKILLSEKDLDLLKAGKKSLPIELKVSKILTTTDEIYLDNETEIVELEKTYGHMPESTPGNYIPATGNIFVESDDSKAETVSITPATGENYNYMVPIMVGISACITLAAGIIFIKKKVIVRNHK